MSCPWAKRAKDEDRPQEFSKDLISRSGRVRKIKDISQSYLVGRDKEGKLLSSIPKSEKATKATETTAKSGDTDKVEMKSVKVETEVASMGTVEETQKREPVKDNKSRVNVDLLQKVLTESVEEWFSFTEVVTNNKGKPYKKRKIVLPPIDESDFSFELTEAKDDLKNRGDGIKKIDSVSDKQPKTSHSEESKKEDVTLKVNNTKKLKNAVIKKECETMIQLDKSERKVDDIVKKEQDEPVEKVDIKMIRKISRTDERSEKEKETENGKNKGVRHFFALILYEDQTDGEKEAEMRTPDIRQKISNQQPKTVIKSLDLKAADLKKFEVKLGDFCKLPKDFPIFECVNGIERLLRTGATGSTLRKSLSAECLNVFPKSENDRQKRSAEMPAMLPSRQRKMNLKAQECFFLLTRDVIEKYKRTAEQRMKQEVQKLREKRTKEVKPNEIIVDSVEPWKKPKRNESNLKKTEKEEMNGPVEEKVEASLEKPEMKLVTNTSFKKATKKQIDSNKDNKMSRIKLKKRKRYSPRSKDKFFSYVNKIKRKSGYKSGTESADSQNVSNKEPTLKLVESTQGTRVDDKNELKPKQEIVGGETMERRKSRREIKLTPKLVHMIATSHKRRKRSPSIREKSMDDVDYEYPNLLRKVVSGTCASEVVTLPSSASSNQKCLPSKVGANASSLDCAWEPGNLIWARFAGSPFWPGLILRDPFSNNEYTKVKHWGRLLKNFVHLQFLADSGKRAWVPEPYCMNFNGLDGFEKMKSNLPKIDSFTRRNDIVYQKAFFPTKKVEKAWLGAVKEGETLLTKSKDERIAYMKIKYPLVKRAPSVANGQLVFNGCSSDESKKTRLGTRKRKSTGSFFVESSDYSNNEKTVIEKKGSAKTNEAFEGVRLTDVGDNGKGYEKETPKISLRLMKSPKKEVKRKWSKSLKGTEGQLSKRSKKDVRVFTDGVPNSEGSLEGQNEVEPSKGGRTKQVCQVCLKMVENEKIIKYEGVGPGLFPKGAELPSLEEGTAPALKRRKRRRKFSSPHINRWKQSLWTIFDFHNEFGESKREEMDVKRLLALYRSLCKNKIGNRRPSAKLRNIK